MIEERSNGKQVTIIGLSHGAQIVVEILSTKPQIAQYAIINSALTIPMPFTNMLVSPMLKMTFGLLKNRKFSRLQAKSMYVNEDYYEIYYKDTVTTQLPDFIKLMNANLTYRLPDKFRSSNVKTLILIGEKEKGIMKKSAKMMLEANSSCKGYAVPNVGHGVSLAKPNIFNRIVQSWISGQDMPKEVNEI